MTSPALASFTYSDVVPLDWFHLRALLWDAWPLVTAGATPDWNAVADFVNARAPNSPSLPAEAYRAAFSRLMEATLHSDARERAPDAGFELWNRILYRRAQPLFGRPVFMNLGYVADHPCTLDAEDEPFRYFIQLYERTIRDHVLRGRRVLEVGCGAGGGCRWVARRHAPSHVTGIDIEQENLATCNASPRPANVTFARATADALPFPSESFDFVVNIESSGHYARLEGFFREVRRVLRPGGRFLFSDLRPVDDEWGPGRTVDGLTVAMRRAGLEPVTSDDITGPVLASVELSQTARHAVLDGLALDPHERRHFEEIMLCDGSRNLDKLRRRELQYWSFVCERGD